MKLIIDKLNVIDERTKDTDSKLDNLIEKVDGITDQVAENSEKITKIKNDTHGLKNGQAKQEKVLEGLSLRSIEQETDIRRLRQG